MKNSLNEDAKRNWQNLIQLWETVSEPFKGVHHENGYSYCWLPFGEWPNRIWLDQPVALPLLATVKQKIKAFDGHLTFPVINATPQQLDYLEKELSMVKRFEQEAMMLELDETPIPEQGIRLESVRENGQATTWSAMFFACFGYTIDPKVVVSAMSKVQFYVATAEGQPVGTAILFIDQGVAGIHAVGVLPQERRKGFAEAIMKAVLHTLQLQREKKVVLQASDMGKPLYHKLGFQSQFVIHNFSMNTDVN